MLYILLSEYLTSCLAVFNILMENFLTIHRILLLNNSHLVKNKTYIKLIVILISLISFLIYIPQIFMNKISKIHVMPFNFTTYTVGQTIFGRSKSAILIQVILNVSRMILIIAVLLVLNIITIVLYWKFLKKKRTLRYLSKIRILYNFIINLF